MSGDGAGNRTGAPDGPVDGRPGNGGGSSGADGPDPEEGGLLARLARGMGSGGVELGGENVRFDQAPEDGLEVRITLLDDDGAVASVASMLLPAEEPPPAQPADVPFIPGAALRVIEDYGRRITLAMWLLDPGAPDVDGALETVIRASREAGWRLEATGPARLSRGDRVRRIEARQGPTGPMVALSEKRARQESS